MSHTMKFIKSKEALNKFMECLQCKKCNRVAENPMRYVSCAHFFCDKCLSKSSAICSFCGIPVKPNEIQPDFVVESLIKSSIDLYNLINQRKYDLTENKDITDKSTIIREKIKCNEDNQIIQNNIKKHDKYETKSIVSISNSSKLSDSKESLLIDSDDIVLSKKMLLNLNKPNRKGEVPLHTACVKGNMKLVRALLNAGANPNTKDNAKLTPLQEAASYGFYEICELLLQNGAWPNMLGSNNQTALHSAVQYNNLKEAELLIKYGASISYRDDHGKKPKDYCQSDEMNKILDNVEDINEEIDQNCSMFDASIINSTLDSNQLVILPINLEKDNLKLLKTVAAKHKMNIVTSFRNEVTHVIVKNNNLYSADLSYEICMAILRGTWILLFEWVNLIDQENSIDIDASIFEVNSIGHFPDTPRRARENAEQQKPYLFNNCTFHFALNNKSVYTIGNMKLTKENIINLAIIGEGKILKRMPHPDDITDSEIVPFHVSNNPKHSLYKCSTYIIYEPGKDEPKLKYNIKYLKSLPLLWFVESIEKFQLVDPIIYGM